MKRNGISDLDLHQLISIVEWWENDSLDINSNQHVLFVFKEYWSDILVTDKNINEINKRLSDMSQICGYEIKITLEFHVEFRNPCNIPVFSKTITLDRTYHYSSGNMTQSPLNHFNL